MTTEVTVLSRLQATDDAAAATLIGMLRGLVGTVPAEPGNLDYEVYRSDEDRSTFYITERWETSEDADRHARFIETDPTIQRSAALLATLEAVRLLPLDNDEPSSATEGPPS